MQRSRPGTFEGRIHCTFWLLAALEVTSTTRPRTIPRLEAESNPQHRLARGYEPGAFAELGAEDVGGHHSLGGGLVQQVENVQKQLELSLACESKDLGDPKVQKRLRGKPPRTPSFDKDRASALRKPDEGYSRPGFSRELLEVRAQEHIDLRNLHRSLNPEHVGPVVDSGSRRVREVVGREPSVVEKNPPPAIPGRPRAPATRGLKTFRLGK